MYNEAIKTDAEDVFEINDFTVVTEFERLTAQLEVCFHEWNICGTRPSTSRIYDRVWIYLCRLFLQSSTFRHSSVKQNR